MSADIYILPSNLNLSIEKMVGYNMQRRHEKWP